MRLAEEVWNDTITWRRLRLLARELPGDSAFAHWMFDKKNRNYAEVT